MNLRQVEIFRVVMTSGTTARAAEILHVSQPAVSKMIQELERSSASICSSASRDDFIRRRRASSSFVRSSRLFWDWRTFGALRLASAITDRAS
ncbi:LysR family transcriptional regulator (plasmid) [Aliirhizobium terrae]|uniref:LysR family transcriptional regulator n=1 Tax=Terrirhizobium terrae TaxID=2926709 RepID=UPI0025753D68|nr:LysR family transcriptional regulator [Rhizobium sp. CC-CFT758]WJH38231.1 LysR family transcriptional regulator [Rhizobium sp. CC-CFT758]